MLASDLGGWNWNKCYLLSTYIMLASSDPEGWNTCYAIYFVGTEVAVSKVNDIISWYLLYVCCIHVIGSILKQFYVVNFHIFK